MRSNIFLVVLDLWGRFLGVELLGRKAHVFLTLILRAAARLLFQMLAVQER